MPSSPSPQTQPKRFSALYSPKRERITSINQSSSFNPAIRKSMNESHEFTRGNSARFKTFNMENRELSKKIGLSKPKNVFQAQLYLMIHIAITICLLRYRGKFS
jgi:hypothetical protein